MKKILMVIAILSTYALSIETAEQDLPEPNNPQAFLTRYKDSEPYEILKVAQNASPKEIDKAFRKLALKWHPDRWLENKENYYAAEEVFKLINESQDVLLNPPAPTIKLDETHSLNLNAIEPFTRKTFGYLLQEKENENLPLVVVLATDNIYKNLPFFSFFPFTQHLQYKNLFSPLKNTSYRLHSSNKMVYDVIKIDYYIIKKNQPILHYTVSSQQDRDKAEQEQKIIRDNASNWLSNEEINTLLKDFSKIYFSNSNYTSDTLPAVYFLEKILYSPVITVRNQLNILMFLRETHHVHRRSHYHILEHFLNQLTNEKIENLLQYLIVFTPGQLKQDIQRYLSRLPQINAKNLISLKEQMGNTNEILFALVKKITSTSDDDPFKQRLITLYNTGINDLINRPHELLELARNLKKVNLPKYALPILAKIKLPNLLEHSMAYQKALTYLEVADILYSAEDISGAFNIYNELLENPNYSYELSLFNKNMEVKLRLGKINSVGAPNIEKNVRKAEAIFKNIEETPDKKGKVIEYMRYKMLANYELAKIYFTGGYQVPRDLNQSQERFKKIIKSEAHSTVPELKQLKESAKKYLSEIKEELKKEQQQRKNEQTQLEAKNKKKLTEEAKLKREKDMALARHQYQEAVNEALSRKRKREEYVEHTGAVKKQKNEECKSDSEEESEEDPDETESDSSEPDSSESEEED